VTPAELPRTELLARLRAQVAVKEARIRLAPFPVEPELVALLPDGGLKPGCAYSLDGAGALLTRLLAPPSREGHWCGVVGMPDFGAEAAAHAGVALDGAWPRAEAHLAVSNPHWSGVGMGYGHLTGREVTVTVSSRRSPLPRTARLILPGADGGFAAAVGTGPATVGLKVAG